MSPRSEQPDDHPRRAHHHAHHCGDYLDVDADVDIAYGDGTPEWLADRLREPVPDAWMPHRDEWHAGTPLLSDREPSDDDT